VADGGRVVVTKGERMAPKKTTRRKQKKKLSPDERKHRKIKNAHMRSVRSVFRNMGFDRVVEIAGIEIEFGGQAGEFDDAFIYENLIILAEYTTAQSSDVTDHIKKKKIIFSNILEDPKEFMSYLRKRSVAFDGRIGNNFHKDKYILKILYCSLNEVADSAKNTVKEPIYLDYPFLKYFEKISSIIKMSALNEMLEFLGVDPENVAKNGIFPKKITSGDLRRFDSAGIIFRVSARLQGSFVLCRCRSPFESCVCFATGWLERVVSSLPENDIRHEDRSHP
jgi:hypothetical protein